MIGVVGPADSVALTLSVADEMGVSDQMVGRPYQHIDEALAIARALDRVCQVLLFTGRVPYAIGRASNLLEARLRYVPHSGADLFRALAHLLRDHHGTLPRISIDTIEEAVVREAYADMGAEPPRHVLALETTGDPERVRSASDIVAFHLGLARAGEVDVCVTCVGEVDRELRRAGVRTWRISHTRVAIREALHQALLAARLSMTESSQPAVVLLHAASLREGVSGSVGSGAYHLQRQRLRMREAALDLAERLQGRLAEVDEASIIVYTSRGAVERAIARSAADPGGSFDLSGLIQDLAVGAGLGATVAAAEEHARQALALGERDGGLHVVYQDGSVVRVSRTGPASTYRLRATDTGALQVARELGIGPLALASLTQALRKVDASAVTAAELARAYGIEPRSARRLMTSLQRAGIASATGRQGGGGAGRPQTVYRIDVGRLIPPPKEDDDDTGRMDREAASGAGG
ncbi:MAG: hypothetical protein U0667_11915 [Chloroflexota bacterium]